MFDVVALRRALKKVPVGYYVKMNVFGKLSLYDRGRKYKGYIDPKFATIMVGHKPMSRRDRKSVV